MNNMQLAGKILEACRRVGVQTFCLCPGGRNAPFVEWLSQDDGENLWSFFDERSASFFALGKARGERRPVALITTSGTAVSEVYSAVIEAHYSQTPLIVISADRPKSFRGTGAPQVIEQKNIFANMVSEALDIDIHDEWEFPSSIFGPIHINVCFDEPLIDGEPSQLPAVSATSFDKTRGPLGVENNSWKNQIENLQNPLVVIAGLKPEEETAALSALEEYSGSLFVESLSNLRSTSGASAKSIRTEGWVRRLIQRGEFDGVVKIGGTPLSRFWRDLAKSDLPVFSLSASEFSGGPKVRHRQCPAEAWSEQLPKSWGQPPREEVVERDQTLQNRLRALVEAHPFSEASWFHHLTQKWDSDIDLFVGNSMPIRWWDLFFETAGAKVYASRGANGIDGQLACGLGLANSGRPMKIVLGDLTFLYDTSALALLESCKRRSIDVQIFVINNGGGKIFSRLFENPLFFNSHNISLSHLALAYGWQYEKFSNTSAELKNAPWTVYEINPDEGQTQNFWQEWDSALA